VFTPSSTRPVRARRLVAVDGLARGRTERTGEARDEEITGLFERDALVFHGRSSSACPGQAVRRAWSSAGSTSTTPWPAVTDWRRGRARGPLHRPTRGPRRRLRAARHRLARPPRLRSIAPPRSSPWASCVGVCCAAAGHVVVGAEDDLMVPAAPDDLVVLGDGALMAALTRTRGAGCATSSRRSSAHQDEAIRAPGARRHRDHRRPRHRQDRRRAAPRGIPAVCRAAPFESGGILVVGPVRGLHRIHRARPALPG
jgi:hypothetical protein